MTTTWRRTGWFWLGLALLLSLSHCGPEKTATTEETTTHQDGGHDAHNIETPPKDTHRPEESTQEKAGLSELATEKRNTENPPEPVASGTTVRFLHYNDLHANLIPHKDLVTTPNKTTPYLEERGGIARLATLVKQKRAETTHSVLMNIGDTFHGGVEALYTNGDAIAAPLNKLGIDIGVPGNWDFAYGPQITRQRYNPSLGGMPGGTTTAKAPNFKNLAANVTITMPPKDAGKSFLPATHIMTFGNVKVGFIGLTSDIVPRMHKVLAVGFSFLEGKSNYINLLTTLSKQLKAQQVNFVVVMSELGIHKDYELAKSLPKGVIDVFFSGHTHEITWTPLTNPNNKTLVMEAGNDGYLGMLDVTFENGHPTSLTWKLHTITSDIKEDPEVKALVEQARQPFLNANVNIPLPNASSDAVLKQPINTVVATIQHPIHRRHALENPFNNALTDFLRKTSQKQIAMTPGFRFDAVIDPNKENDATLKGKVTLEDIYRFFPVLYTLGTGKVQASRLKEILEDALTKVFSPNIFKQSGGWLEGFSGLDILVKLGAPDGQRVQSLRLSGTTTELSGTTELTIAGCRRPFDEDGTLCSHTGFTDVQDLINPSTQKAYNVVDFVVEMLKATSWSPRQNITDQSQTPVWPQTPFIQPLEGVGQSTNTQCSVDGDCGADEMCDQGQCVPKTTPQCTSDSDCRLRMVCKQGVCVRP